MVTIRVPATSGNVGVGFDCLGLAVQLYSYFTFEVSDTFRISGCEEQYQNQNNLVYTSYLKALEVLGVEKKEVAITIVSHVPVARGLGSSATCVVGGVLGAYYVSNTPIDKQEILKICSDIEGHPDNVAPAIFGGLVASYQEEEVCSVSYKMHEDYHFLALIPDFETKTEDARKVLPKEISYQSAVRNSAKLSVALKAFETYDVDSLHRVMKDELHEPYRKQLIHEYDAVKKVCEDIDSICFYISGSGSTLMNVMRSEQSVTKIQTELNKLQHNWKGILVKVDTTGACIC